MATSQILRLWNLKMDNCMGTVVDNQNPQIGYLGGMLMYRGDYYRFELKIPKDIEKSISEVFPTSDKKVPNFWARDMHLCVPEINFLS